MFDLEILGEVKFLVERLQDLYPVIRYLLNVSYVSGSVVLIIHSQSLLDLFFPLCSQSLQQPKFRPSGFLPPLSSTTCIPCVMPRAGGIKSTHVGPERGLSSITVFALLFIFCHSLL